ncbi:twin-arginine translocation signal domain-containing protein [Chitinophaga sp. ysch24]|uniref:Twin-arginine translocation signal domain-containing protein n=1 Tax=Chitinophaga tropicalis TaxID=2683588 RepID=A0A7K1U1Y5_9BACT|nr:twin-arginine translocation signal domain-containing protein [Chitinophaga tropicalis]
MINYNSRRSFIAQAAMAAALVPLSTFGKGYEKAIDQTPKASSPSNLKITKVRCGYIRGSLFVKRGSMQLHNCTPIQLSLLTCRYERIDRLYIAIWKSG